MLDITNRILIRNHVRWYPGRRNSLQMNHSLKTKSWHDVICVVNGNSVCCHDDNLRCQQWQQSWHCDSSRFSVNVGLGTYNYNPEITRILLVKTIRSSKFLPWFLHLNVTAKQASNGPKLDRSWCRHYIDTLSASLAFSDGNPSETGELPLQRTCNAEFDVFFVVGLRKLLKK